MVQPGPRSRTAQDILNRRYVEEVEIMSPTPDAFDTTRKGVLVLYSSNVTVRCKNQGSNSVRVQIEASVDGVEFDTMVRSNTGVTSGNSLIENITGEVYRRVRVLVRNSSAGQASSVRIDVLGN